RYLIKALRYPEELRRDFTDPALLGFCGALAVGMFLVGVGGAAYSPGGGSALWWAAQVLVTRRLVWGVARWRSGSSELAPGDAGWLIVLVGGIAAPGPGLALGHAEAARFAFGVSAAAAPLLMALLFYRAVLGAPLPERLRPSWFIL